MRRFHVILSVPVADDEDSPRRWNWQELLDTAQEVVVLDQTQVDLLSSDDDSDDDDDDSDFLRDAIMHDAQVMAGWGGVVIVNLEEEDQS